MKNVNTLKPFDDVPYDASSATAVAAAWKGGVLTRGGGVEAVKVALARARTPRGPQKAPKKELINIRLSPDVLAAFKAQGSGWQTRIDSALRDWLGKQRTV